MAMSLGRTHLECPVLKIYGDIHRAIVVKGACFLRESGRRAKNAVGGISWRLSLDCFHDRNRVECNLAVEMRDRMSRLATTKKPGLITSQAQPSRQTEPLQRSGCGPIARAVKSFPGIQTRVIQVVHYASSKPWPASLCLGVVVFVLLAGIIKLKDRKRRAVRTRILRSQWYKDSKQESGTKQSSVRWRKSPSRSFYNTNKPEASSVYNHLVIHDGQVITGGSESPTRKKTSPGFILAGSEPFSSDMNEQATSTAGSQRAIVSRRDAARPRSLFQITCDDNTAKSSRSTPPVKEDEKPKSGQDSLTWQRKWNSQDELDLKHRIEELHRNVQAAEANRKAAVRALAEERKRSLELEVKISRQKEAALSLEEEVRVLKESHEMLLNSLRKKYSSSVAARAAAALLYQNWEEAGSDVHHSVP